jgi:hypothetical protein
MRLTVGLVALLTALTATTSFAGAVTLDGARSRALKATRAERSRGGVILFGLRAPVRAHASIRELGRRPAPAGSDTRVMRSVLHAGGERAYFFYLDRGAYQSYEHPGRVLLVDAASGRVTRSRAMRFAPVIDGSRPIFLRSREGYDAPAHRVSASEYSVSGAARAAAANPLGAFGAGPTASLRSAASESVVATSLAAERSCTVAVGGPRSASLAKLGSESGSPILPLLRYDPSTHRSLAAFVDSEAVVGHGCRDVLIGISGDGYRSISPPASRTSASSFGRRMREYHVTAPMLRAIVAANPSVTFELMIDGPGSGAYVESLRSLANVLLIATSSAAGQTAYRYLPSKLVDGRRTPNPLRMRADSSFFTTQLAGAVAFAASGVEVAHAAAEVAAGRAPSFLAYLIARAFALGRPFDFTADLGATQRLYVHGFAPTPPGEVNRPPVAAAQTVTTAEDTPTAVRLAGSDPDGDPLTFTIGSAPSHGTLSGHAPDLTYTPAADYDGPDSFTFIVGDGPLVSETATVAIAVTAVDDPPVTRASGTLATTENDPATAIAPALDVVDVDSAGLTGATVQITGNHVAGEDVLALPAQPAITASFDAAGGTLTLSGSADVAAYQAALRAVTYANSSDDPASAPRTVAFRARDAGGFGPAGTRTITVAAVDDPPAITTSAGPLSYTESDPPAPVDGGLVLTDPDSQVTGATVQITGNHASPEDVLALPSRPSITAVYVAATGTLTLSGADSPANYQLALRAVTYRDTSTNPSTARRTVTFVARDAAGASAPATRDVAVGATDDAPDVHDSPGALAYVENQAATAIDTAIAITDPDSPSLTGATVQITGNHVAAQDVLALASQPGLTSTFDAASGRLTVSGTASVAAYETALEAVAYRNTSDDPSTSPRTVAYAARDAGGFGLSDTHGITITAVDDPPVAVDDLRTIDEDAGASAIDVLANDADVDAGPRSVQGATNGGHGTVAITGPGAGVAYTPSADYCNTQSGGTPDTFTYTLGGGSVGSVSVTVACVDDPPVALDDSATVAEDSPASAVAVLANDTDVDGGTKTVIAAGDPAHGTVLVAGGGVTYRPDPDYCGGPDTFAYTLGGGSSATVSMTVTCVDDPPVAVDDSATVLEDAAPTALSVLANDTDVDGGPKTIAAVAQPAHGTVSITPGAGLTYAPGANYCNGQPGTTPDTFSYTLGGGSTATVSMTVTCVDDAPVADDETFSAGDAAVGNTALVGDAPSDGPPALAGPKKTIAADILVGDSDVDGPGPLAVIAGTFASNDGGSVTLQADGDFTYTPAAGTSCTDSSDFFDYTVSDQSPGTPGTDVGRVTIALSGCVWYVDNAASGDAGTSTAPFDTLQQAQAASGNGDTIFVSDGDGMSSGYGSGIDLKANQRLVGEAATLQVGPDVLQAANPARRPTIADQNADVVALGSGNTVRGIAIDPAGTGGAIAGGAGDAGGTIDDVRIIDGATGATQPDLELDGTSGTFDVSDLTIDDSGSNATSSGVRLNANSGVVNFRPAGTISIKVNGGRGLDATSTNMGTGSAFDDIAVASSGSGGVSMVDTTGATSFGDLALTTSGASAALRLVNAGAITVAAGGTDNLSATLGPALDVTGTPGATLAFDAVASTNSTTDGVNIAGLGAGSFSAGAASAITSPAGIDFDLDGGSGAIAYGGTISDDVGQLVRVANTSAGTKDFGGAIGDGGDGDGSGISLTNNAGATIHFGGGLTLATGSNPAFVASGGGTVAVTDPNAPGTAPDNTLATTTAAALTIANTAIGAGGVTFRSISSNGATNGIVLDATGAAGSLAVTGSGGTCTAASTGGCSGGQIANSTGADSAATTPGGTGIVLDATKDPSFTRMWIHDHSNYAIRGHDVAGFALDASVVNGTNGDNGTTPFDDGSVLLDNLSGSASISASAISGGFEDNVRVHNTTGSLDRITFSSTMIGDNSVAGGNDAIGLQSSPTAGALKATVQGSTFTGAAGDLVDFQHNGTGAGDLVLTGDAFSNGHAPIATGGGGLTLSNNGTSGSTTMSITNNTFRDAVGNALTVFKTTGASTQTGTFDDNAIGVAAAANSGSAEGSALKLQNAGQGTVSWTVSDNQIRGYNNNGVEVVAGGGATAQAGAINATITANTITQPGTTPGTIALAKNAIHFNIGTVGPMPANDSYQACAVITGNSLATGGADGVPAAGGGQDIRLRQRKATTIRLPGYGGAATDLAAVQSFVAANNPAGGPSVIASADPSPPGGGFTGTGSSCP